MRVALLYAMCIACALQIQSCTGFGNISLMNQTLLQYFSEARHHVTNPAYKKSAMLFIRDEFRSYGLETHLHTFINEDCRTQGVNVIGILKGRYFNTPLDSVVGIGAHYDTVNQTEGVNDNGAAVVTLLQVAREISRTLLRNSTVLFMAFDFEEVDDDSNGNVTCRGLCGSQNLVDTWLPVFLNPKVGVKGVFIMDTIFNYDNQQDSQVVLPYLEQIFPNQTQRILSNGKRGDFLLAIGRTSAEVDLLNNFDQTWKSRGSPKFGVETFPLPLLPNPLPPDSSIPEILTDFLRSDHKRFWQAGLPSVFLTDSANFRGYMSSCYHQPCDSKAYITTDRLNFIAKTARTLIALVDKMAPKCLQSGLCTYQG